MPDIHMNDRNEDALRKREATIRVQHDAAVRAGRRKTAARVVMIAGLAVGLGWTVYNNGAMATKLATRDTVYGMVQANGEVIASTHYTEIPPAAKQEEQIQNALWTYAQARDCYGSSFPVRQYYIAQAMSDEAVGRQVKEQFALSNPNAPQHVYGEHGITVQCELVDPPTPIGDPGNHAYLFRFRRWEQTAKTTAADMAMASFYTVTVQFRTGVYPENDPRRAWLDRTTFNAPGVQVIESPGAKPSNASPRKG